MTASDHAWESAFEEADAAIARGALNDASDLYLEVSRQSFVAGDLTTHVQSMAWAVQCLNQMGAVETAKRLVQEVDPSAEGREDWLLPELAESALFDVDFDEARRLLSQVLSFAVPGSDRSLRALSGWGECLAARKEWQGLTELVHSMDAASENPLVTARMNGVRALWFVAEERFGEGAALMHDVRRVLIGSREAGVAARLSACIGRIFIERGEAQVALEFLAQATVLAHRLEAWDQVIAHWVTRSDLLAAEGREGEAIDALNAALDIAHRQHGLEVLEGLHVKAAALEEATEHQAMAMRRWEALASIAQKRNDVMSALRYLLNALRLGFQVGEPSVSEIAGRAAEVALRCDQIPVGWVCELTQFLAQTSNYSRALSVAIHAAQRYEWAGQSRNFTSLGMFFAELSCRVGAVEQAETWFCKVLQRAEQDGMPEANEWRERRDRLLSGGR